MAEFQFKCPQCGQVIEADESFRGQVAPCPFCEKNIVIPNAKPPVITSRPKPKQTIRWKRGQQTTSQEDAVGNPVELQPDTTTSQEPKAGFWRRLRACFTTKGRAQRKEYWIIEGASLIFGLLIGLFVIFVVSSKHATSASKSPLILVAVLGLAFGIASLCVWIRRLHDLNRSEWWLLSPIVGKIACKVLGFSLFSVLMDLIGLAWFIVLGSIDGTPGENDYGSDPKGRVGSGERTNTAKIVIWILVAISTVVTVIALLVGNFMPELFEKDEEAELRQSTYSDTKDTLASSYQYEVDVVTIGGVLIRRLPGTDFEKVVDDDGDEIFKAELPEDDAGIAINKLDIDSMPKNPTPQQMEKLMDEYLSSVKVELKKQFTDESATITIVERTANTVTFSWKSGTHVFYQKLILDMRNGRIVCVTGGWNSNHGNTIKACVDSARLAAP